MSTNTITFRTASWGAKDYLDKIARGEIELAPDFQRNYIWDAKKKSRLIDSFLRDYPIPPIWLWETINEDGVAHFSVIDGQQRLSCLREFTHGGFKFKATKRTPLPNKLVSDADGHGFHPATGSADWPSLSKEAKLQLFKAQIPHIIVSTADRSVAVDVFTRLNLGSQNINAQELRNAVYGGCFKSFIYAKASELKKDQFWGKQGRVFCPKKADRMDVERHLSELVVSILDNSPLHKSDRLDHYYATFERGFPDKPRIERELKWILACIKAHPATSRFNRNITDFYSLSRVYVKLRREFTLVDRDKRLTAARDALEDFSKRFSQFEAKRKGLENTPKQQAKLEETWPIFRDYRDTIQGPQQERAARRRREEILWEVASPVCETTKPRDKDRLFPDAIKQLAWSNCADRKGQAKCNGCKILLRLDEAEFDHIDPWSNGGRSTIENCQVLCDRCNRTKGAKTSQKNAVSTTGKANSR